MNTASRVLVAMGAVTLMTYGSALAQQAPAQPPQAPPSSVSPAIPPSSPSPSVSAQAESSLTANGELLSVDARDETLTVKTTTGEVKIKYDDDTKVSGASRNTAGLATMSGSQVMVRYKKDGSSNVATSIEVKPASAAPGATSRPSAPGEPRPTAPDDRPTTPSDPTRPTTPRP
jgi:uncharacterized protein with beta-barrel porin domain